MWTLTLLHSQLAECTPVANHIIGCGSSLMQGQERSSETKLFSWRIATGKAQPLHQENVFFVLKTNVHFACFLYVYCFTTQLLTFIHLGFTGVILPGTFVAVSMHPFDAVFSFCSFSRSRFHGWSTMKAQVTGAGEIIRNKECPVHWGRWNNPDQWMPSSLGPVK